VHKRAREKLDLLHHAQSLNDLRVPPANQLEKLAGNRRGQWSIRIDRQWQICFSWRDGDAWGVEITDYH
jgi:proteic killer suppression protein